ncbi:MAG: phosphoribosyltransferase family protein [Bacteroidota bacterium]
MNEKQYVLSAAEINIIIKRLALQVAENVSDDNTEFIIVGIMPRGFSIAQKIADSLSKVITNPINLISLSMDKDNPTEIVLDKQLYFNHKNILIIDDVVNNGRTLTYAIKPFLNYLPNSIQTLVLVERMYKLFPIKADYIGLSIATTNEDHIVVEEMDGEIVGAYLK